MVRRTGVLWRLGPRRSATGIGRGDEPARGYESLTQQPSRRPRREVLERYGDTVFLGRGGMYQIEVKRTLVQLCFHPANGWKVQVDVDSMEKARGGRHPADKAERAAHALGELEALGATIGPHPRFGRVDVVAEHPEHGLRLIEVEGSSSRQTEQAVYSALGQLLISMKVRGPGIRYGLAVPEGPQWERQLRKLPTDITKLLALDLYLVGPGRVSGFKAGEEIVNLAKGQP